MTKKYTIELTQEQLDELNRQAEETKGKFKPKLGEWYWRLRSSGVTKRSKWQNNKWDNYRYLTDNCFRTEEEALAKNNYQLALGRVNQAILAINNGNNPVPDIQYTFDFFEGEWTEVLVHHGLSASIFITCYVRSLLARLKSSHSKDLETIKNYLIQRG